MITEYLKDKGIFSGRGTKEGTVKSHILNALRRAEKVLGIFPEEGSRGIRGKNRRQYLAKYLRMHMEELRPHLPPKE
jgi:hypothetical protein